MSLPVVDYLKLPEGEDPYLEGHKCNECGSIFWGQGMFVQAVLLGIVLHL